MPALATEQFFGINELVMQLGPLLNQSTLSKLMRTSKHLYEIKSFFFYHLDFFDEPSRDFRLLRETAPIEALRKAVVKVRVLATDPLFIGHYYQCLRKYQEEINTNGTFATYTPAWMPSLDLSNSSIVSLPPLANLTVFNCYSQPGSSDTRHRYCIKGIRQGAVRQAQALWILKCCPSLTRLGLEVIVMTQQDVLVLAFIISKIPRLKRLELSFQRVESLFSTLGSTLFFKAPTTLDELGLDYDDFADEDVSGDDEYFDYEQDPRNAANSEGESARKGEQGPTSTLTHAELQDVLTGKQEPLSNLTRLTIQAIRYITLTDVLSIFDHCPNITSFCISYLVDHIDTDEVGRHIANVCSKLHTITHTNVWSNGRLVMSIIGAMPEEQLEGLSYIQLDKDSSMTAALILRHSTSLWTIRFDQCCQFSSKAT